jgi:hypothetical protein
MRTTLDIDADVLAAANELAAQTGSSAGKVLSRLAREVLLEGASMAKGAPGGSSELPSVYGFRPFPKVGVVVTNELINRIKDPLAQPHPRIQQ